MELRVPAAHLVAALLVARLHLGMAHRQRRPAGDDGAEAVAAATGRAQQIQVDLDVEHPLHAAHVRVAERLVGVDERAGALDAGTGIDDLVAVHLAAAAFDLVLRAQGQVGGCRGREAVGHAPNRDSSCPPTARLDKQAVFRLRTFRHRLESGRG